MYVEEKRLDKAIRKTSQLLAACERMIERVRDLTDIMEDDQGRTLFIFTTITIIFLPLSFVASYISMSNGSTGLDWGQIQTVFWEVGCPLTLVVLLFCLAVAKSEDVRRMIPAAWVARWTAWRITDMWHPRRLGRSIEESGESSDDESGTGK